MCNALGVDPLAASVGNMVKGKEKGNERGWWALLKSRSAVAGGGGGGGVGVGGGGGGGSGGEGQHEDDLHLRLAMRVVEICRAGRSTNGGLLGVGDCREMVKKGQGIGGEVEVTEYVLLIFLGGEIFVEVSAGVVFFFLLTCRGQVTISCARSNL